MRTFVQARKLMSVHKELENNINKLESKYDEKFETIFSLISHLIENEKRPKEE